MTPLNASPAITDADLARLLGWASATPAAPAELADRIMARLAPISDAPPMPELRPARGRQFTRRWARLGIGTGISLLIGTAVAAGLAQTPAFAPYLQPLLAQVRELAGTPNIPSPAPAAAPARPAPARLAAARAPASAPVRIEAALPAPAMPDVAITALPRVTAPTPALPAPALRALREAAPALSANPGRPLAAAIQRRHDEAPVMPAAALANRAASEPDLPGGNPAARALPGPPDQPALAARAAALREQLNATPADAQPLAADIAAPASPQPPPAAADRPVLDRQALPATAAERAAALADLRAARQAGRLTPEQAQQLRALQQLRAARSARPPREAGRRPPG